MGTFSDVLAANADYARRFLLGSLARLPSRRLAVLTCIDARIDPLAILGLRPGEAVIVRNAGGRYDDRVGGALVVAQYLLGVERVMVMAHTDCRATAAGPEAVAREIEEAGGPDARALWLTTAPDPATGVRNDVRQLRGSPLHRGLEVGGFVYRVENGVVTTVC
jgi:carbonic anhydrase